MNYIFAVLVLAALIAVSSAQYYYGGYGYGAYPAYGGYYGGYGGYYGGLGYGYGGLAYYKK